MRITHSLGAFKMAWAPFLALDAEGIVDRNLVSAISLLGGLSKTPYISDTLSREIDHLVYTKIDLSLERLVTGVTENFISDDASFAFERWLLAFPSAFLNNSVLLKVRWLPYFHPYN